jgi:endoglucanase
MDQASLEFLQELCDVPGPSGFEAEASRLMKGYVEEHCDRVYNDKFGNMMFEKIGQKDGTTVLVAGHVDECGFIVTGVNAQGYMSFSQLGGWFDQVLLGPRMLVHTRKGVVRDLMEPEEVKKVVTKDKMFIDVGASNKDEA